MVTCMKTEHRIISGRNNKKGIALVYAILILVVVSILSVSVLALFSSNLRQEEYQKEYMEAYYLAYSGIQMAFSAITAEDNLGNPNDLFNKLKNGSISECTQNGISYGAGVINIKVIKINDISSTYNGLIKITSTGKLNSNGFSVTRCLYIDPLDQQNVMWENN
jgi:hypothetical protein